MHGKKEPFLDQNIWSKMDLNIKNIKITASLLHTRKKDILTNFKLNLARIIFLTSYYYQYYH